MEECKHTNYVPACIQNFINGRNENMVFSLYHVYCKDCKTFINLLTRETLNEQDIVPLMRRRIDGNTR